MNKNNVEFYRIKSNITQQELAYICECSLSQIRNIERGRSIPNVKLALKIAEAINTTVDNLFKK